MRLYIIDLLRNSSHYHCARGLILALVVFCRCLQAEETPSIEGVPAGVVHQGDYFACSSTVEISGRVTGDVYAMGSQIIIDGEVEGDVLACGGSIQISGNVAHNIRVIAGQVTLSGAVGGNATLVAGSAQLIAPSYIGGNVVTLAGTADLAGGIGGGATLVASNIRLSSLIGESAQAFVGHMRLTSKASIGKNLIYDSSEQASIEKGAKIHGEILYHPSLIKEILNGKVQQAFMIGSKIAGILMNFIYTLVIGLIWLRLYPVQLEQAEAVLMRKPWKAMAYGVLLIVFLPIASLIFLMTILGAPFALTLIALNVIGFYTAKVITIFWASGKIFRKIGIKGNTITSFSLGIIGYFFLTAIPFIGPAIAFTAMLLGLGAVPLARMQHPRS